MSRDEDAPNVIDLRAAQSVLRLAGVRFRGTPWHWAEVEHVQAAIKRMRGVFGSMSALQRAIGNVALEQTTRGGGGAYAWWFTPPWLRIVLSQAILHQEPPWRSEVAVVHELAHAWDARSSGLAGRFGIVLGFKKGTGKISRAMSLYVGDEPGPTNYGGLGSPGSKWPRNPAEEWAESLSAYVYPEYIEWLVANVPEERDAGLRVKHREFVGQQIDRIKNNTRG
jgi:hypothetical protein